MSAKDIWLIVLSVAVTILLWDWWKRRQTMQVVKTVSELTNNTVSGDFDSQVTAYIKANYGI